MHGSQMSLVRKYLDLLDVRAEDVIAAAHPPSKGKLLRGSTLSSETDATFAERAKPTAAQKE